jgi:hypothetical protein
MKENNRLFSKKKNIAMYNNLAHHAIKFNAMPAWLKIIYKILYAVYNLLE